MIHTAKLSTQVAILNTNFLGPSGIIVCRDQIHGCCNLFIVNELRNRREIIAERSVSPNAQNAQISSAIVQT